VYGEDFCPFIEEPTGSVGGITLEIFFDELRHSRRRKSDDPPPPEKLRRVDLSVE